MLLLDDVCYELIAFLCVCVCVRDLFFIFVNFYSNFFFCVNNKWITGHPFIFFFTTCALRENDALTEENGRKPIRIVLLVITSYSATFLRRESVMQMVVKRIAFPFFFFFCHS